MAMRTCLAVSMLASLTLVAPASFARGGGHGGGGHGGGGHSTAGGHASHGGGGGHISTTVYTPGGTILSNGSFASSFGTSHASSFTAHDAAFGGQPAPPQSPRMVAARASLGYANPYAGSAVAPARPAVIHSVTPSHRDIVPGGPVVVAGRVRGQTPGYRVGGVAVAGFTPHYRFRVPAIYSGYFSPYATYVDATYWATDWVITDTFVEDENAMEGPGDLGAPAMDGMVKEELREEIAADLAGPEETEASPDDPRIRAALASPAHVFLVSKDMAVQNQKGFACALRAADLVRPLSRVNPDDKDVPVVVLAAKGGECRPGEHVVLSAASLAEFERDLLTRVDHAREAVHEEPAAPVSSPSDAL